MINDGALMAGQCGAGRVLGGVQAGWHPGVVTMAELFTPIPLRWGLRGDPHLWEAMRLRFIDDAFPADQSALIGAVRSAFEELTGVRLRANIGHVSIPAYRTGSGISDGVVDGDWWHDVGLALLLDRWNVASASGHRAR